jgi:hypothetical protein
VSDKRYETEARGAIDRRIAKLRTLTMAEAARLPEASGEGVVLGDVSCHLTVFAQHSPSQLPEAVLVTVQVARKGVLGIASYHVEQGLVFFPNGTVRDATDLELQDSGG